MPIIAGKREEGTIDKALTNRPAVWFARTAMTANVFFFIVMFVAFVFIQPELNPLYRYGSEYAVGRMGWLMKLNFFVWGIGLISFACAMAYGLDARAKSRVAIILFVVAGVGIFLSGIFDSDLQVLNENPPPKWIEPPPSDEQKVHIIAGLVAFFTLMPGMGLAARRLRIAGRLSGGYRWLRYLSWTVPVMFVASIFVFGSMGLTGLGQRVFLACVIAWIVLAAWGLHKGAFSQRE